MKQGARRWQNLSRKARRRRRRASSNQRRWNFHRRVLRLSLDALMEQNLTGNAYIDLGRMVVIRQVPMGVTNDHG